MNTADTFALGLRHHQTGDLSQAEQCYRQVLLGNPQHRDALHLLGLLALQSGRTEEGTEYLRQVLRLDPSCAQAHFNLGSALRGQGRLDEAIASYRQVLALQPNDASAHANLGHAFKQAGRFSEALEHYQQALLLNPNVPRVHLSLGILFGEQGRLLEAETYLRLALQQAPGDAEAYLALAVVLNELHRNAEAVAYSRRALQLRPDDLTAHFVHAALTGSAELPAAPREYVVKLFDGYAGTYDNHLLNRLSYRGPQLLREAVADLTEAHACDILDLGCGTGLCGLAFCDLARTLTGVDLSPGMLAQARARGIYHRLIQGDLLDALNAEAAAFHLILAGDVFIYIGDLARIFAAVRRTLRAGGRFVFLVEANEGEDYVLRATKRFAHSLAYLRKLAHATGLIERNATKEIIRTESGKDVEGYVVALGAP